MRVTQQQLHRLALGALTSSRSRLSDLQRQAASGMKVEKPSDDPTASSRARILTSIGSEAVRHQGNATAGLSRLQTAESSLARAGNLLVRAKEISLAMANGSMSAEDRQIAALEVGQIRSSLIDTINTKHGSEFVFAHVATDSPLVNSAGNLLYNPNVYNEVRGVEVAPGQVAEIGASGSHAFTQRAAEPGSVDVLNVLAQLEADLQANDIDGVRSAADTTERAFSQVVAERARTGLRMQRLNDADTAAKQSQSLFEQLRADLTEVDAAEAFSRLSLAQTTVQAAVAVATRILGPSLLDSM